MAINILFEMIRQKNDIFYYSVQTKDYQVEKFFISIDPKKNEVCFFSDQNFTKQTKCFDFKSKESLKVDEIPEGLVGRVLAKAYRAIKKNDFPKIMQYAA